MNKKSTTYKMCLATTKTHHKLKGLGHSRNKTNKLTRTTNKQQTKTKKALGHHKNET